MAPMRARPRGAPRALAGVAAQDDARGAIAEQRGGDEHGKALVLGAHAQRAEVDREEQYVGAGPRLRHAGGAGKAADAGAAAQPEHGQPLDVGAEGEAVHQARLQARDGEPGDRVGDDDIDIAQAEAGFGDGLDGDLLQEVERVPLIALGALLPGMRLQVPLHRLDGIAAVDAGVGVEGFQPRKVREERLRPQRCVVLGDGVLRNRGGDRGDLHSDAGGGVAFGFENVGLKLHARASGPRHGA